jgi:hypothetical protein
LDQSPQGGNPPVSGIRSRSWAREARGILAARLGNRDEARRISDELRLCDRERCSGHNYTGGPTWRRARIAAALGDRDGAVRLLRQVLGVSFPYDHWVTEQFLEDEPLRDYPPFQELIRPKE